MIGSCCWLESCIEPIGRFLYHISPALVAVALGSFVIQKFFVSRSNKAALIDCLIERLSSLEDDALEYWNLEYDTGEKKNRGKVLEQKIKGGLKSLAADLTYYSGRYGNGEDFTPFLSELSDCCTGGDFESRVKKRDSARYIFVVNGASKLRSRLLRDKM